MPPEAIEVLLKHKAFFVKRLDPGHDGVIGQVSWAKNGGVEQAWSLAQANAGVPTLGWGPIEQLWFCRNKWLGYRSDALNVFQATNLKSFALGIAVPCFDQIINKILCAHYLVSKPGQALLHGFATTPNGVGSKSEPMTCYEIWNLGQPK